MPYFNDCGVSATCGELIDGSTALAPASMSASQLSGGNGAESFDAGGQPKARQIAPVWRPVRLASSAGDVGFGGGGAWRMRRAIAPSVARTTSRASMQITPMAAKAKEQTQ